MFQLTLIIKKPTFASSDAPEFKNKTEKHDIYVGEGDNVTLNCEAEGNPPPVFHWTNDRVNILENTNNLYINQVNTSASYNCTATNVLGSVHKSIFIHVEKTTMAKAIPEASTPISIHPYVLFICSDMDYISLISVLISVWILFFYFVLLCKWQIAH